MKYYTSDCHLDHRNIIKYEGRPFDSTDDMNSYIINNINEFVGKKDILHILGDFSFSGVDRTIEFLRMIKCKNIVLVLGNHDAHLDTVTKRLRLSVVARVVNNIHMVKDDGKNVCLCHFPIEEWPSKSKGCVHLHGHSHGNLEHIIENRFDIGVDTRKWNERRLVYKLEDLINV